MHKKLITDKIYIGKLKQCITKQKAICEDCIATCLRRIKLKETSPLLRDQLKERLEVLNVSLGWFQSARDFYREGEIEKAISCYASAQRILYAN